MSAHSGVRIVALALFVLLPATTFGQSVQTRRQFGVSCLVIRSITDRADGQAGTSYEQFVAIASENAAAVVAATIERLAR